MRVESFDIPRYDLARLIEQLPRAAHVTGAMRLPTAYVRVYATFLGVDIFADVWGEDFDEAQAGNGWSKYNAVAEDFRRTMLDIMADDAQRAYDTERDG